MFDFSLIEKKFFYFKVMYDNFLILSIYIYVMLLMYKHTYRYYFTLFIMHIFYWQNKQKRI